MSRSRSFTTAQLREAIEASRSITETLTRLGLRAAGGNFQTIKRHAAANGISMDHFEPDRGRRRAARARARPLVEVLVEDSTYTRGTLKRRLYAEGLKGRRCELCGQDENWNGRRMALILDHINGVATDNRLENLQIVCPNCAATLDTHCGRNQTWPELRVCAHCDEPFQPERPTQRYCSKACGIHSPGPRDPQPERRKVDRPSYDQLLTDLSHMSYLAVGRKYGVSDNAIRKWLRWYERERDDEAA